MLTEEKTKMSPQYSDVNNILTTMKTSIEDLNKMISQTNIKDRKDTILLVDDDASQITSAKAILQLHYTLVIAQRGGEAVEVYRQNQQKIKAVLLDIRLPDLDGFEVFKRIKLLNNQIPIIFITAYQSSYDSPEIIYEKFQPFGYIVKNHEKEVEMIKTTLASAVAFYNQALELDRIRRSSSPQ